MKVNFYLDKPYNPDISPEKVKQELAKVGGKKKNLAQKFWNPSPTALYLFFSPDKSCRIKYRTNYKILPKSWDFEKERLKPSAGFVCRWLFTAVRQGGHNFEASAELRASLQ